MAVSHALTIINWQENLITDEMPPEWMWPLNEELDDWFAEVKRARDDDSGVGDRMEDAPDMMQNTLSAGHRRS